MGRRIFDTNVDLRNWPPQNCRTDVYLPGRVGRDFRERLGSWEHLAYLERQGVVRLVELEDGEGVEIGGVGIEPFRLAEQYVYAFVFTENGWRALIASDGLVGWRPLEWVKGADLAILPMGVAEFNPLAGERHIQREHPMLGIEAPCEETLGIVEALERVILTHIEEVDAITHDDLRELGRRLRKGGRNVEFAYDTLMVDV